LVDGKDFYYADFPRSEWSKHNSVVPLYLHPPTPSAPEMADQPVVPAQGLATATAERILAQREEILRAFVAKYGLQPDEAVQVLGQDGTWRIERRTPSAPVVMLTGYQLRAALNFIAPDRDDDQLSQEVA